LLLVTIAIAAGTAGALALATDLPVSIAGVAIAAAIVPAAAVVGLGIVWLQPLLALGALTLLLLNMVLINITAFLALRSLGYRSSSDDSGVETLQFDRRTIIYAIGAIAVILLLGVMTVSTYQYFLFGQTVNRNVNDVLSQPPYTHLELVQVQTDYGGGPVFERPTKRTVTIIIRRSSNETYPHLSAVLQRRIAADTDKAVTVSVRFIDYQQTTPRERNETGGSHRLVA
jgi:uncharacterized membrane protein